MAVIKLLAFKVVVEMPMAVTVNPALAVINVVEVRPAPDTFTPELAVSSPLAIKVVVEMPVAVTPLFAYNAPPKVIEQLLPPILIPPVLKAAFPIFNTPPICKSPIPKFPPTLVLLIAVPEILNALINTEVELTFPIVTDPVVKLPAIVTPPVVN